MKKFIAQLLGLYTKQEIGLAVEFGVTTSETARGIGMKKFGPVVQKVEDILISEFLKRPTEKVALDMVPLILAAFQPSTQD